MEDIGWKVSLNLVGKKQVVYCLCTGLRVSYISLIEVLCKVKVLGKIIGLEEGEWQLWMIDNWTIWGL